MRPVGEVGFANGVAASCAAACSENQGSRPASSGTADMMLGSRVEPVFERADARGGDRFRGIRHGVSWGPRLHRLDESKCPRGDAGPTRSSGKASRWSAVLAFLRCVLYHTQIGEVRRSGRCVPNTRIVLNHVGGVSGRAPTAASKKCFRVGPIDQGPCCRPTCSSARRTRSKLHCLALRWDREPPSSEKVGRRIPPLR